MRNDRLLYTAFAIGALGPKRALKYILLGIAGGILFWIVMGIMIASNEEPAHQMTKEELQQRVDQFQKDSSMYGRWYFCQEPHAHITYPRDCP